MEETIVVMDLLAPDVPMLKSRIEELGVKCVILDATTSAEKIKELPNIKGIILSGGPQNLLKEDAVKVDEGVYKLNLPILGICYGFELTMLQLGGQLGICKTSEVGKFELTVVTENELFEYTPETQNVYMNHSEECVEVAKGFEVIAKTETCRVAAVANRSNRMYGVQFHPEKSDTTHGGQILKNFVRNICLGMRN